jgi:hypothetical protein
VVEPGGDMAAAIARHYAVLDEAMLASRVCVPWSRVRAIRSSPALPPQPTPSVPHSLPRCASVRSGVAAGAQGGPEPDARRREYLSGHAELGPAGVRVGQPHADRVPSGGASGGGLHERGSRSPVADGVGDGETDLTHAYVKTGTSNRTDLAAHLRRQ